MNSTKLYGTATADIEQQIETIRQIAECRVRSKWIVVVVVFLFSFLNRPIESEALEPVLMSIYNAQGMFGIVANNLNDVTEARININYQSDSPDLPQVSGTSLAVTSSYVSSGSISLQLVNREKPMSGYVLLAVAKIEGSITSLSGQLIYKNKPSRFIQGTITNPSKTELERIKAELEWKNAELERIKAEQKIKDNKPDKNGTEATPDINNVPAAAKSDDSHPIALQPERTSTPTGIDTMLPAAKDSGRNAVRIPETEERFSSLSFARHSSLLERFGAMPGERTPVTLVHLLQLRDAEFNQEPPLVLSDGIAALQFTVRPHGSGSQAPQFFIFGGNNTRLKTAQNGAWTLEIVPKRGALDTSVIVMAGGVATEYPLAVAPPLELFDAHSAGSEQVDYVKAANEVVRTGAVK